MRAHRQHLLFPAGEGPRQLPAPFPQAGEELVDPLQILLNLRLVPAQIRADFQVFQGRQVREHPPPLRAHGDARADDVVNGFAQQFLSVPLDGPGGRLHQAGDGPQGGGLPRAVGPNQGDDFPVRHLQRDAPQGLNAPVTDPQVLNLQHRPPPPDTRQLPAGCSGFPPASPWQSAAQSPARKSGPRCSSPGPCGAR